MKTDGQATATAQMEPSRAAAIKAAKSTVTNLIAEKGAKRVGAWDVTNVEKKEVGGMHFWYATASSGWAYVR